MFNKAHLLKKKLSLYARLSWKRLTFTKNILRPMNEIKLIAFDADDTLWGCQSYFDTVERAYCEVLAPYADAAKVSKALFATESANMPLLGYGSKAFLISLIENAINISDGKVKGDELALILGVGKELLRLPGRPFDGVRATLAKLKDLGNYHLVVFTKGELLDQETKFERSGLRPYFDDIVIVSDKTTDAYFKLCERFNTRVDQFLMVGNSFRSDIEPVLKLGGWAAHIPSDSIWKHEVVEEYDHPNLIRLNNFAQLQSHLSATGTILNDYKPS